ncbi:MAG: DUF3575 domain-containing protein [Bacteroidales bacterium]|jgi:hypothetical protein|nr:DUF3575 domain-containing protein [Bacteroidales bacterium]
MLSLEAQIHIKYSGSLKGLLVLLQDKYGYRFMYSNDDVDDRQELSIDVKDSDIGSVMENISGSVHVSFEIKNKQVVLKHTERKTQENDDDQEKKTSEKPISKPIRPEFTPIQKVVEADTGKKQRPVDDSIKQEVVSDTIPAKFELTREPVQEPAEITDLSADPVPEKPPKKPPVKPQPAKKNKEYGFALHTNLLYDLALTPNIGVEYYPNKRIGFVVNALWSHIDWDDGKKTYRSWAVLPEVRFHWLKNKRLYTGAVFQLGKLNLKLGKTGRQGNMAGGGIIFGYLIGLGKRISLDTGLAFGYTRFEHDTYQYIEGTNVKEDTKTKHFFGPVKVNAALVWKIR